MVQSGLWVRQSTLPLKCNLWSFLLSKSSSQFQLNIISFFFCHVCVVPVSATVFTSGALICFDGLNWARATAWSGLPCGAERGATVLKTRPGYWPTSWTRTHGSILAIKGTSAAQEARGLVYPAAALQEFWVEWRKYSQNSGKSTIHATLTNVYRQMQSRISNNQFHLNKNKEIRILVCF